MAASDELKNLLNLLIWADPIFLPAMISLQVLRYLLPAAGLPEQNDAHASDFNDRWLLGHSHFHLFPAHHAGLEQHRYRPPGELQEFELELEKDLF